MCAANSLQFQWQRSVDNLKNEWNECFYNDTAMRSWQLQKTVEDSKLSNAEHYHLLVHDEKGLAAFLPCFVMKISLVTVAPAWIQNFIAKIRKVFPKFLYMRMFFIGSAFSSSDDLLGFKDFSDNARWSKEKVQAIFDEVVKKAKEVKCSFVIAKELPEEHVKFLNERLDKGRFFFPESLPTAYLNVASLARGGYIQSIKTKYRNKLKKRKSVAAEHGLYWKAAESADGLHDRMYDLHSQVMAHADVVFEHLNKEFFHRSRDLFELDKTKTTFYTLGFQKLPTPYTPSEGDLQAPPFIAGTRLIEDSQKDKLICAEFILSQGDTLYPLYTGFEYEIKEQSDLYFNAYYALIDEAEKRGFARIHLGQTAYEVKAELGCTLTRLFILFHHRNPLIHKFLELTQKIFFAIPKVPERDVFATPPTPPKNAPKNTAKNKPADSLQNA